MKKIFPVIIIATSLLASCHFETIKGSGVMATEVRTISDAEKIKAVGSFDVEIMPGTSTSLKIEGDDNLIKHIITEKKDGYLVIRMDEGIGYLTENKLVVYITTPHLEAITSAGSGNVTTKGKFTGSNKLKVSLAGSGNTDIEVNTPTIEASIAGSGDIKMKGETKDLTIKIAGSGNFNGDELKAENAEADIAGSGDVKIFADVKLDAHIAGSGSVLYQGNATVTQKIVGSGEVKKM
ncbi:head GIN domain-containing protein [Parasediminibacterium paludis]|uniref:Head GIN domain-containing protein n=1 Tax=Parasediminibacterium paludis TaxID=908966 RepID=A0ABV8Q0A0_9BACT